jgi:hypothetical protein
MLSVKLDADEAAADGPVAMSVEPALVPESDQVYIPRLDTSEIK